MPAVLTPPAHDERAARQALRSQIERLEGEAGGLVVGSRLTPRPVGLRQAGPRLLGLGELERTRDALVAQVADLRAGAAAQATAQAEARRLRDAMLLAPARHKWVRVTQAEVGDPGCGAWEARPRLGLIGMLMGWWQVKLSSGCPLAG